MSPGSAMKLLELADSLERLEETRSRGKMVEQVAELLRSATRDERGSIVYLLQARLRPEHESIEIGLGEKLLVRALAKAYGVTEPAIRRRFLKYGDLGRVAESLAPVARGRVSVTRAYGALLGVARTSGRGSLQRKIQLLADLLHSVGAREAKLVVRIAQGKLRLGLGDQTILEAAALGAFGHRDRKKLLEHAYNVRSDLGNVVCLAFDKRTRSLTNLGPELGVPVRPALAQRLPSAAAIVGRLGKVQVEPKYDGFRLQLHRDGSRVWMFSRRLENVTSMFPDLAAALRKQLRMKRAIIEGEAIAHNPDTGEFQPFQVTMTRKRKTRLAEMANRYPLRLFAFDILYAGHHNCMTDSLRDRARRLRRELPFRNDSALAVTESIVTSDPKKLQAYFDDMIARGLEGIVAKRLDAPYQAGARGFDWVKLKRSYQSKLRDTVDVVLVGYLRGRGKRASLGIGSLVGAVYDPTHDRFRTVAKIGSGLTDAAWKQLRSRLDEDATHGKPARVDSLLEADVWVEPRYVVEVLADEITRSPFHTCGKSGQAPGYALRFPRLVSGVRTDKAATDATTQREIIDMYKQQRKT
ncbi:MAG: ATP-dependent DNA ligase [Gemmatimonadaceae bacterium]